MNKLKIILIVLLTLNLTPSYAMENAPDAINDGRTVPIMTEGPWKVCTGFLYSSRIVLTAGHCLFSFKTKNPYEKMYVGLPGQTYSKENVKMNLVEKTFFSQDWSFKTAFDFSDKNDFGILVLKEPIAITGKTTIATQEQIDTYIKNKTMISTIGYGRQAPQHDHNDITTPKYGEFPLVELNTVKQKLPGSGYYGMKIHILQTPNGPSTCGGDSGSAFYIKNEIDFIYLGPLAWGIGGMPACSGNGWRDSVMYVGSVAAYDYIDLIKEAEDYVAKQNIVTAPSPVTSSLHKKPSIKISIKCYKGKEIKKIYGINPKCPKGYKVKV